MNGRILLWSITSALAGFLFGFDTVVISGAEQSIQALWGLSAGMHGIAMASALYGTVLGSLIGGWPTDRFGRKPTLLFIGILYIVGAVGSALANDPVVFIAARFIGGLGHRHLDRGRAALHLGNRAAGVSRTAGRDVSVQHRLRHSHRLLVQRAAGRNRRKCLALDAGRRGVSVTRVYRCCASASPKARAGCSGKKNDREAGMKVLRLIEPEASEAQIASDADEILAASSQKISKGRFWTRALRIPILLAFLVAFFNQLSGINAILYFAPRIFELTGLGGEGRAAAIGRHRHHQPHLHLRRPLAD